MTPGVQQAAVVGLELPRNALHLDVAERLPELGLVLACWALRTIGGVRVAGELAGWALVAPGVQQAAVVGLELPRDAVYYGLTEQVASSIRVLAFRTWSAAPAHAEGVCWTGGAVECALASGTGSVHQPWDQGSGHTAPPCRAICPGWASATAFAGFLASFRSIVVRGTLGTVQLAKLNLVLALGAALAKEPPSTFCVLPRSALTAS